ncbi:hypothetical protein AYO44_14330 [Planctomycetaceae bacterium SCGC AG-212-F19]|nr:hypothetical protein AYO44_14330 [Planctomycetaceae bacterium SCGC AG-212-F19]
MVRAFVVALILLGLSTGPLPADEPVFSGPQPGEKLTAFKVAGVLNALAGKEVELLGEIKGAPTVLIFVHEWTRQTLQLARPLDLYGTQWAKDGLNTQFVVLSADRAKAEQYLNTAKGSLNLKSPVSVSMDGQEGPGNYGLNRKMTVTILIAKENKVLANFAIVQPNETDAPKVLAAVARMLDKPAPSAEEIRAATAGSQRGAANDKDTPDPELGKLMRRLIQKDASEETVKEVAMAMRKWAGDDAQKKTQLTAYCKKVLELGYGNDLAKRALKRLAGD